jgi:tetratricopeptide (TPR) repeat protein
MTLQAYALNEIAALKFGAEGENYLKQALDSYQATLSRFPGDFLAFHNCAIAQFKLGPFQLLFPTIRRNFFLTCNSVFLSVSAESAASRGDLEMAKTYFDGADENFAVSVRLDPRNALTYSNWAAMWKAKGVAFPQSRIECLGPYRLSTIPRWRHPDLGGEYSDQILPLST